MAPSVPVERGTTEAEPHTPAQVRDAWALVPAMAGLVMLAMTFVFMTWWGARMVRRRIRQPLGPSRPLTDEWYSKPLVNRPPARPPQDDTDSSMGS